MNILGISAYYHDAAAAMLVNGEIVAAAQEERFTRKKHDAGYPSNAIAYCLKSQNLKPREVDYVAFYDQPLLKFQRLIETYCDYAPKGVDTFRDAMRSWLGGKLFQKRRLILELEKLDSNVDWKSRLLFSQHHVSHASSAFFPSPFDRAAILTMDGVGEWATTSLAVGIDNHLRMLREIRFPHSIGLLYSAFTYYTGFKVNSGEYKLMGLAPYGEPIYADKIRQHLIDIKEDGTFHLNMEYFDFCTGFRMTNERFDALFSEPRRMPEMPITQHHMNIASSIQCVTEEVVLKLGKSIAVETGEPNLCLAGGVALNCVANGKLLRHGSFDRIWIQPAAGDAGGALGAALAVYHICKGQARKVDPNGNAMKGSFLGPDYSQENIEMRLEAIGAKFEILSEEELLDGCASALVDGKAVGWHQGRMEFGPRALGARSILGDPRSPTMQKMLNLKIKYRESFRPFAPSVLRESVADWFEIDEDSPYMLLVSNVKEKHRLTNLELEGNLFGIERLNVPRSSLPAITHVDYSARLQTVHKATNPKFHALISRFKELTNCPVLVNTSFNVRGEPIVQSPEDAFRCFMGSEIDILAIGNCLLRKESQDGSLAKNYKTLFEPD
jgi:carbamoyltransferase